MLVAVSTDKLRSEVLALPYNPFLTYPTGSGPRGPLRGRLAGLVFALGMVAPGCQSESCPEVNCTAGVAIEVTLSSWSEGSYVIEAVEPGGLSTSCTLEVDALESWTQNCTENAYVRSDTSHTRVLWLSALPVTLEVRVLRNGVVLVEHEEKVSYVDEGPIGCQEKCEIGKVIVSD